MLATRQRQIRIMCGNDFECIVIRDQPHPTRAKMAGARFYKLFCESVIATEVANDEIIQNLARLATTFGRHARPEECMIPTLSGIVENLLLIGIFATAGCFDNLLQRKIGHLVIFDEGI